MDLSSEKEKQRAAYIQKRRAFYQLHKDRISAQKKQNRLLNKDKVRAADKKYRERNKQKIAESQKRWYLGRSEEMKEATRCRDRERYRKMGRRPKVITPTSNLVEENPRPVRVSKPQSFKDLQSNYLKRMRQRHNETDDIWRSQFSWASG